MEGALLYLFSKIDRHDHGHITKKDIMKAMRDKEIVGLLESCPPLQPLLRPRSYAATFHAMDTNHDGSIEYEELRMFCAGMYSIDASNDIAVKMDLALNSITKGYNPTHGDNDALNQAEASQENLNEVLHKIFAALHTPSHDEEESEEQSLTNIAEEAVKVTKVELLRGLHKPEVRETIRQCPPLVPLLKPRAFWATLMAIDTDHDGTISYEEVRGFCAGVLTAQNALVPRQHRSQLSRDRHDRKRLQPVSMSARRSDNGTSDARSHTPRFTRARHGPRTPEPEPWRCRIQEIHGIVIHLLCDLVEKSIFNKNLVF